MEPGRGFRYNQIISASAPFDLYVLCYLLKFKFPNLWPCINKERMILEYFL